MSAQPEPKKGDSNDNSFPRVQPDSNPSADSGRPVPPNHSQGSPTETRRGTGPEQSEAGNPPSVPAVTGGTTPVPVNGNGRGRGVHADAGSGDAGELAGRDVLPREE